MNAEARLLELLSASLVRPFILVAAALLVFRIYRVEHPASKHAVWTFVLAGMLLLPFASVFAPHVDVPALPQGVLPQVGFSGVRQQPEPQSSASSRSKPIAQKLERAQTATAEAPSIPFLQAAPISPRAQTATSVSTPRSIRTILRSFYFAGVAAVALYRIAGRLPGPSKAFRQDEVGFAEA